MRSKTRRLGLGRLGHAAAIVTVLGLAGIPSTTEAEPQTKVILNGKPVAVFFNDGDSFRVLTGTGKARLRGYNTLESYGPVHQWGSWTAKELYVLAKMATLHARAGVWECSSDGKLDTYGRMLVWCPELAEELVRMGYAHVLSIDDNPGEPALVAAQKEAIENRRGLWSHGVPDFVLTSLHSAEEDVDGHGTYNRLVSTKDGHSAKWKHNNRYNECDKVCQKVYEVDETTLADLTAAMLADNKIKRWTGGLSEADMRSVAHDFIKFRHLNRKVPYEKREKMQEHMERNYVAQGKLGDPSYTEGSCMIHVPFKRRFGGGRAECLK